MKRLFPLALLVAPLLLPAAAVAQPERPPQTSRPDARPHLKLQRPAAKSCAEFGAGFVRLKGSDTCVRIGGYLDVGTSVRGR